MSCHTWFYRDIEHLNKQLCCEFHDVFRTSDFEETLLTSFQETIDYIKENNCETFKDTEDNLRQFFDKYPNGVIEFG